MKYTKKPVEIEAKELTYNTEVQNDIVNWINSDKPNASPGPDGSIFINTLEGQMLAVTGDYIIKGVKGEFYPCKPDIFELTYEPVKD